MRPVFGVRALVRRGWQGRKGTKQTHARSAERPGEGHVATSEVGRTAVEGPEPDAGRLRDAVFDHLDELGIKVTPEGVIESTPESKQAIRDLHRSAVIGAREAAKQVLVDRESQFVSRLAIGDEICVQDIRPRLVPVTARTPETLIWRWVTLHWSIPTSTGYGRRLRYLVVDAAHGNALIGVIGLGDPVFALGARDSDIGWTRDHRKEHLHQVMDAFVLGAVPPYSRLIGSKLVALLAISNRVRDDFREKYDGRIALISGKVRRGPLAAITTTSALGASSAYNRLQAPHRPGYKDSDGRKPLAYNKLGYTNGSGDFHFHGEIYERLREFVAEHVPPEESYRKEGWSGNAYRNRREVITRAFDLMGLNGRKMRRHGIRREVYVAPLTDNYRELLTGQHVRPFWRTQNFKVITEWWLQRWALQRAERRPDWRDFNPETWRIWTPNRDSRWMQR